MTAVSSLTGVAAGLRDGGVGGASALVSACSDRSPKSHYGVNHFSMDDRSDRESLGIKGF